MKNCIALLWVIIFSIPNNHILAQSKKPLTKAKKCTTYVYNLTTGVMTIRDICFGVNIIDHFDLNDNYPGRKWDKKNDFWKLSVSIVDNNKLTRQESESSYYIYEDSDYIKQYHSNNEDSDIKAIIFNKSTGTWQILVYQNDEYKILSSYSGYHYSNAFNIKEKKKSSISY